MSSKIAAFIDYGGGPFNGLDTVMSTMCSSLRDRASQWGRIGPLKLYLPPKKLVDGTFSQKSQIDVQISGGNIVGCPYSVTAFMSVDIMSYAAENPETTILLATNNPDLAYLVSTLRNKGTKTILFTSHGANAHLLDPATPVIHWTEWFGPKEVTVAEATAAFPKPPTPGQQITVPPVVAEASTSPVKRVSKDLPTTTKVSNAPTPAPSTGIFNFSTPKPATT